MRKILPHDSYSSHLSQDSLPLPMREEVPDFFFSFKALCEFLCLSLCSVSLRWAIARLLLL